MIGIYKITSPSNKVYIGQSWNIERRKEEHRRAYNKCRIHYSIKKYGWLAHNFEIVHEFSDNITQEELDKFEVYYWKNIKDSGIIMLNTREPGIGGRHSEDTKSKMKISRKNQVFTEETKRKISISKKNGDNSAAIARTAKYRAKGSGNPRATLNEDQVMNIRIDYRDGMKRKDIVLKYKSNKAIIDYICSNKSWKHVKI